MIRTLTLLFLLVGCNWSPQLEERQTSAQELALEVQEKMLGPWDIFWGGEWLHLEGEYRAAQGCESLFSGEVEVDGVKLTVRALKGELISDPAVNFVVTSDKSLGMVTLFVGPTTVMVAGKTGAFVYTDDLKEAVTKLAEAGHLDRLLR